VRLPVPSVGTAVALMRATVSWSVDTVVLVAALPSRIDDLFSRVDALIASIEEITARAGGEFACQHGDIVFITPDETKVHRFDTKGLAIRA